ncbi:MAG: hypothetical protein KKB67_14055, partial [Alphaproteobacteria bacterium]|nr:hypothetical protein [Alphaproteobacteria bacterium]
MRHRQITNGHLWLCGPWLGAICAVIRWQIIARSLGEGVNASELRAKVVDDRLELSNGVQKGPP